MDDQRRVSLETNAKGPLSPSVRVEHERKEHKRTRTMGIRAPYEAMPTAVSSKAGAIPLPLSSAIVDGSTDFINGTTVLENIENPGAICK